MKLGSRTPDVSRPFSSFEAGDGFKFDKHDAAVYLVIRIGGLKGNQLVSLPECALQIGIPEEGYHVDLELRVVG